MHLEKSPSGPNSRPRKRAHADREAHELLELTSDAMPGGFAICRAIRDRSGKIVDFRIEHANTALQRMTRQGAAPVGRQLRDALPQATQDWIAAGLAVLRDRRSRSLRYGDQGGAWQACFAAAGPDGLSLLITDRTEAELEEHLHAERLMEVNHRTKNNLASVAGMLRLQAGRTGDPAVREQLIKAANRVDAVSDAHASLYRFGSDEVVDIGAYLRDLCGRLSRGLIEDGRVTLDVDAVAVLGPFEHVLSLGIVVNELVTNAAKHAYPDPMTGTIRVCLAQTSDGVALTVSDDGRGLPCDLGPKAAGLGIKLIRSLVRQMHGHLEVTRLHPGTAFQLRLPRPVVRHVGAEGPPP